MSSLFTLDDLFSTHDIAGKTVLLRADFNVPMSGGKVVDMERINRTLPTIHALRKQKIKLVIISHFGRPDGQYHTDMSMAPIADAVSDALGGEAVRFAVDCIGSKAREAVDAMEVGEVLLLENLRFHNEEKKNDDAFAKELASLADYFVNDAFSCSHRAHASIVGVSAHLPSFAGRLLESEITHLASVLIDPQTPVATIVGGSKVSTKIDLLTNLVKKVDYLMIGGGMANVFFYAQGHDVGASLCEKDLASKATDIMALAEEHGCTIMLPSDLMVAKEFAASPACDIVHPDAIAQDDMALDIGPQTVYEWAHVLEKCKTVMWNGPVGAFELSPFDVGSSSIARVMIDLTKNNGLKSIAGGGDVLALLAKAGLRNQLTYVSTAGGAFLEWLEGKDLAGVAVLCKKESLKS